jgi:hypothetical protein
MGNVGKESVRTDIEFLKNKKKKTTNVVALFLINRVLI